ncbi:MAG: hypothetical protein R3F49_06050 [Planctomycetota bacterium]
MRGRRWSWSAVCVVGTLAALATVHACWIGAFGVDVPIADEWDLLPFAHPSQWQWADLWAPHNHVHRLPVPRLVYMALGAITDWDFRAPMLWNLLGLVSLALLWIWAAARVRGRSAWTDVLLVLLLLRPSMSYHVMFGFQLTFLAGAWIQGALLALWIGAREGARRRGPLLMGVAALTLPLTGANGLLAAAPLLAWVAARGVAQLMTPSIDARRASWLTLALTIGTLCVCAAYVNGLTTGNGDHVQPIEGSPLRTGLQFLGGSLGLAARWTWPIACLLLAAALGLLNVILLGRALASAGDRWRYLALVALAASGIAVACGVAIGRGDVAWSAGFAQRYTILSAPIAAWVYLVALHLRPRHGTKQGRARAYAPRVRRYATLAADLSPSVMCAALVVTLPADLHTAQGWLLEQRSIRAMFADDVRTGARFAPRLLAAQLARDYGSSHAQLYPDPAAFRARVERLRTLGLGPYRRALVASEVPAVTVLYAPTSSPALETVARLESLARVAASFTSVDMTGIKREGNETAILDWRPAADSDGPSALPAFRWIRCSDAVDLEAAVAAIASKLEAEAGSPRGLVLVLHRASSGDQLVLRAFWPGTLRGPLVDSVALPFGALATELVEARRSAQGTP